MVVGVLATQWVRHRHCPDHRWGSDDPEAHNFSAYAGVGNNISVQAALTYACAAWSGAGDVIIDQGTTSGGVSDLANFTSSSTSETQTGCTNVIIRDKRQLPEIDYTYSNATTYVRTTLTAVIPAAGIPVSNGPTSGWASSITSAATSGVFYDTAGTLSFASTLPTAAVPGFTGGDTSNSAGSLTMTVNKINGNSVPSGAVANDILVGTGSNAFGLELLPDCHSATNALAFNNTTQAFTCNTITAGSTKWSDLTNPTAAVTITAPVNDVTSFVWTGGARSSVDMTWTAGADSGSPSANSFTFTDTTANTGTGALVGIATVGTSTQLPVKITAQGTSNGVDMTTAGLLQAIGTGNINATEVNGNTFPAAASFTQWGVAYASTTSAMATSVAPGSANLPLISQSATAPVWGTVAEESSATAGGITYYSSTTQRASSALLAQYQVVIGGGAGNAPATLGSVGTSGQALVSGGAGANPSWGVSGLAHTTSCTSSCAFSGGYTEFDVTLAQSATSSTFSGTTGAHYLFTWAQNGTGGYGCTYPSGTIGASPCYTVASHTTYQSFTYNGTNLIADAPAIYN